MFLEALNIFFPKLCYSCDLQLSDYEVGLCTLCRHKLPVTNYHKNTVENPIEKIFYGRVKIVQATALLRFEKKGITQRLIHQLKYKNQQEIGTLFGEWLGEELSVLENYKSIDCIIPVPLHKKKLKQRGYNQVTTFAKALANKLHANYYDDVLIKTSNTTSQVTKNRLARWQYKNTDFHVSQSEKISNKHILLVDDLVTTGATLEACAIELQKADNIKISIATIAAA